MFSGDSVITLNPATQEVINEYIYGAPSNRKASGNGIVFNNSN